MSRVDEISARIVARQRAKLAVERGATVADTLNVVRMNAEGMGERDIRRATGLPLGVIDRILDMPRSAHEALLARVSRKETAMADETKTKSRRGFAAMSPEKHREIASKGGRAVQASGKGHRFTPEEARAAGRKGGLAVSSNREHMSAIGKLGGTKVHPDAEPVTKRVPETS